MAWELVENIRGHKGDKGDKGDTGSIDAVAASTLPSGSPVTAALVGPAASRTLLLGIPQGAKGDKGPAGTISSAAAVSVPAGEPARVIMSGNSEVMHADFEIPRGLPGVNAVENDEAVAEYVSAFDSQTKLALNADYPIRLVWDGAAYPPRVPNAVNIFFGPEDPGLLMDAASDFWAKSDATTLDAVVTEMLTNGSALNEAAKMVSQQVFVKTAAELEINSTTPAPLGYLPAASSTINGLVVRNMRPDGPSYLSTVFVVPRGWKSVKFSVYYTHSNPAPTGGIRWQISSQEIGIGTVVGDSAQWTSAVTDTVGAEMTVRKPTLPTAHVFASAAPVLLRVGVYRNAGHSGDTFASDASLIAIEMTRDS